MWKRNYEVICRLFVSCKMLLKVLLKLLFNKMLFVNMCYLLCEMCFICIEVYKGGIF